MSGEFFDEILNCLAREGAKKRSTVLTDSTAQAFFRAPDSERAVPVARAAATAVPVAPPLSRPVAPAAVTPARSLPNAFVHTEKPLNSPPQSPARQEELRVDALDLAALQDCVSACSMCRLAQTRNSVVFGEGNPRAELMFVGEGPGADEDAQGRPFVGEAGQLLDKMILAMGFARSEVYIANVVKCRPPRNRNPLDDEAAACLRFLRRQIECVNPRAIVTLGNVPLRFLLQTDGITRSRGKWLKYREIPVMPTFHPAYLLRDASKKREVWEDLKQVMRFLGKPLPGVGERRSS